MSIKSEIWVQAFLRRCFAHGHYGAVLRKGAAEAGAIYVVINRLDGRNFLYGPPPGPAYDEIGEKRWELVRPDALDPLALQAAIASLARIDPDIWVVEIEDRDGGLALKSV
ncbi:MAG: DUF1491 family protein [Rhizobiales bacterium]|nr:DUF1491 family protein [Hyphomicrobiales bacterium]